MCFGSSSPSYPAPLPKPAAVADVTPVRPETPTETAKPSTDKAPVQRTTAATTGLSIPTV